MWLKNKKSLDELSSLDIIKTFSLDSSTSSAARHKEARGQSTPAEAPCSVPWRVARTPFYAPPASGGAAGKCDLDRSRWRWPPLGELGESGEAGDPGDPGDPGSR